MINIFKIFRGHIEERSDVLYLTAESGTRINRVKLEVADNAS